jgi:acid phosphatase family membrane protein YuiD
MKILELFTNPFLLTSISGWALAQIIKIGIYSVIGKKFDWQRLFASGGMPSAHTATVVSLTAICGFQLGFQSFEFALAMILTIIVCHDAMGVRLETQKQNLIIKKLLKTPLLEKDEELKNIKLKNSVGHTLPEIIAGAIVGILTAILMNNLLF